MRDKVYRRIAVIIAVIGTLTALFNLVRAEEGIEQGLVTESYESAYETEDEEVPENAPEESSEDLLVEIEVDETSCEYGTDAFELTEETYMSEEAVADEPDYIGDPEETTVFEEAGFDVQAFVIGDWYVPAFDFNSDGTVTYYLPDGEPFYTVSTDGLELPEYAWAYTGLRGYIDYRYGSVNGLSEEQTASLEAATDELLSGEGT